MTNPAILVATDFSSRADRAIDRALQMGRDTKSPVRFLYALEPGKSDTPTLEDLDRRRISRQRGPT